METPPPSSDSKPKAIIVGNVNISPMPPKVATQYTPPSIEPTLNRLDMNERPERERDSTVFDSYVGRLKIATIVFVASMFVGWRLEHWDNVYYGQPRSHQARFGLFELFDMVVNFFTNGVEFNRYDDYFLDLIGSGTVFVFSLRDLMFVFLTAAFVVCWLKRDQPSDFYEKIGTFLTGYFCLIAVGLIWTRLGHGGLNVEFYTEYIVEDYGVDVFLSPGFWLAGLSGVLIHPKWIPISENLMLGKKPAPDNEDSALHGLLRTRTDSTAKTSTSPDILVMFLYYLPPLYLCMVALDVSNGGNDDAFFMGIMAPIIGFLVGLFHMRWEFFNGFLLQLGFSFPVAFVLCVAGAVGLFGDISDFGEALLITLLAALILPFKYHRNSSHGRALGAIYGATLGVCLMLFGLMLGVISRYGFF